MTERRSQNLLLSIFTLAVVAASPFARADDSSYEVDRAPRYTVRENEEVKRFRLAVVPEAVFIGNNNATIHGFGLGADLSVALSSKFAAGGAFRQSFQLPDSFSSLFSEIDLHLDFAITGSFVAVNRTTRVNGIDVLTEETSSQGGFRAQLLFNQYFFDSSSSVLSFAGVGLAGLYEFPSTSNYNFSIGCRVDAISSGTVTLFPIRPFGQLLVWL